MIDLLLLQADKGGEPEAVRESQRRRGGSVELVDEVIGQYRIWTKLRFEADASRNRINAIQKEITAKKKAKEDAEGLVREKSRVEADAMAANHLADAAESQLRKMAVQIGNLVHDSVPRSMTEDDNAVIRKWSQDGQDPIKKAGILSHHEVLYRLEAYDQDRGTKIAGHRGFFLTGDGVDLNQALINYGLDFLKKRGSKKLMTPFFMRKDQMAKTAQLSQFDEELYKVTGGSGEGGDDDDDKYLIATSEQPISAYHSGEWFDKPSEQLPIRYAGYSTCFRKEAGAHGKDTWGIFRVHQFEKVEQFCLTEPAKSWEMFDEMISNAEGFYQSLGISYQIVAIVSGALNNAAAKKYDLEAWFPNQGAYKELVSCSNCTDYQSRRLEIRCGTKKSVDGRKIYVHCLNCE